MTQGNRTKKLSRNSTLEQDPSAIISTIPSTTAGSPDTPSPPTTPQSRKQKRKGIAPPPPFELPPPNDASSTTSSPTTITTPPLPQMASQTRLLVCSIGNPAPYLNTLHSAGHTVLNVLCQNLSYPSFQKSRVHGNGLLSPGNPFTLWQSPALMNVSGAAVSAAWKQFLRENKQMGYGEGECGLVVVHDELELRLGEVKVRSGDASPKGHNGLKSIRDARLGQGYTRIGVGIGRPESRDAGVVAGRKIEGSAGRVMEELMRLSEQ
ncbi:hypothetical protein ACMFMF_010840 [Clarireedia jacksonii]